jgi:hypothetical protein
MNWSFGGVFIGFAQFFSKIVSVLQNAQVRTLISNTCPFKTIWNIQIKRHEGDDNNWSPSTWISTCCFWKQQLIICVKILHLGYMKIYLGNMKSLWMKNLQDILNDWT